MISFRDSLIKHFNFSESDWRETISRSRSGTLPPKTLFPEKGKVADRIALRCLGMHHFAGKHRKFAE